jgi:integrase
MAFAGCPSFADKPPKLDSIGDLLHAISSSATRPDSMLITTARHLAAFAGEPLEKLPIETLIDVGPEFSLYLAQHRYADNSIRTYRRYAQLLLRTARELGWQPDSQPINDCWKPVLDVLATVPAATKGVVRYAVRQRISPTEFSDAHLSAWGEWMKRRGRTHLTARKLKSRFRKVVVDSGLEHLLPRLNCRSHGVDYKINTDDMPEPPRTQVRSLLKWKTDRYSKGRPQHGRLRPVSAVQLENWIGRLLGFARNVAQRTDISSLTDLLTEDIVTSFVEWAINVRNLSRTSLMKLSLIYAAVRHHPDYKNMDWQWFHELFSTLPDDPESARLERKTSKMLPYDVVVSIPDRIRAEISKKSLTDEQRAWLAHDALLVRWLTVLPWRQRNIRECRLGDPQAANLFLAELPTGQHVARPKWVEDALVKDPKAQFWQFYFRESETKTGQQVRAIVPRCLINQLEEYLSTYRAALVGKDDPGTLFLNRWGGRLTPQQATELVSQLVLKYGGRRVTPHLFRSIFAYKWLEVFPDDFLTLSKILWHRDINTTLRIYGGNFDESNGARRIDEWLGA